MKRVLFFLLCLFVITRVASAADHYVRQGATGANNGSDWTNAWTSIPATLTRGDTYYIADGSYGRYTFNAPQSATSVIMIRKATTASHGTDTGWDSTYGDGQAIFTGWSFTTGYWNVDGVTGSGTSGYGIVVHPPTVAHVITIDGSMSNIHFSNIEANVWPDGTDWNSIPDSGGSFSQIVKATTGTTIAITFNNVYFHHVFGCMFQVTNAVDWIVENSRLYKNKSTPAWHAATICDQGSNHYIFRNNFIKDNAGSAIWDLIQAGGNNDNSHIYNNVVWHSGESDWNEAGLAAIVGVWNDSSNSRSATNWRIYNNTFVNLKGVPALIFTAGSGNIVQNNLWYCNRTDTSYTNYVYINNAAGDYNAYMACALTGAQAGSLGAHDYTGGVTWGTNCPYTVLGTTPFVNWQNGDFHLTSTAPVINKGTALGSLYNMDISGIIRPQGPATDIGAYEYSIVLFPMPPTNIKVY